MLLDASGTPIRPTHALDAPPAPAAPVQGPENPFAHLAEFANPKLADELRGIADLVEAGVVFDVTLIALGKDVKRPEPLTLGSHAYIEHMPMLIGELDIIKTRIASDVIRHRTPKARLANGAEAPGADA
jgi:hypothetical protein